ncbi:MAG TPA: hypothetical protein VIL74_20475 [Pyrinomonadaceae bacterium]|jgi:hypothetical protein
MKRQELDCREKQNLSIWYCENCKSVHLRVGDGSLTFSPQEFLDFASMIGELYGRASLEALKEQASSTAVEFGGLAEEVARRVRLTLNYQ